AQRPQRLVQGPVRDPLAVGQAATDQRRRLAAEHREELAGEPRLADAGGAPQREAHAGSLLDRARVGLAQARELRGAADEWSLEMARDRGDAGDRREQPPGWDGPGLALRVERPDRLEQRAAANELFRLRADEDLAGAGQGLEALRHVDGVAGHERPALGRVARDHLAGVDASADAEPHAEAR